MKKYQTIGHISMIVLLILAIKYYLIRTLYVDPAAQIFEMILSKNFEIYVNRYSMVLNQILPWISINLRLQLKYILLTYSISFVLVYYGFYLICTRLLKNVTAGLTIVLTVVCIRHAFIHSISETYLGIVYASTFYAWLYYPRKIRNLIYRSIIFYVVGFILMLLCYFIHPVTVFMIVFVLVYKYLDEKKLINWKYILLILLTCLLFILKFIHTKSTSHEDKFYSELYNFKSLIPSLFKLNSTSFFFQSFTKLYIYPVMLLGFFTIWCIKRKEYLKLGFTCMYIIFFLLVTWIVYNKGDSTIAMESRFMPIMFFVSIPIGKEIMEKDSTLLIKKLFLIGLITIGYTGIIKATRPYTERLKYLKSTIQLAEQFKASKLVIEKNNLQSDKLIVNWAYAFESLMYSSLQRNTDAKTIYICESVNNIKCDLNNPYLFLAVNWNQCWNITQLDTNYFQLEQEPYFIIKYEDSTNFLCDAEEIITIANDVKFKCSRNSGYSFDNGISQSRENSHSGKSSCKLKASNPYGMTFMIPLYIYNKELFVSVYKYGSKDGYLVISDKKGELIYHSTNTAVYKDSLGWEKLELKINIEPEHREFDIITYVWNAGNDSIYFDDLEIFLYKSKSE